MSCSAWMHENDLPPSRKLAQRIRTLPTESIVTAGSFVVSWVTRNSGVLKLFCSSMHLVNPAFKIPASFRGVKERPSKASIKAN